MLQTTDLVEFTQLISLFNDDYNYDQQLCQIPELVSLLRCQGFSFVFNFLWAMNGVFFFVV